MTPSGRDRGLPLLVLLAVLLPLGTLGTIWGPVLAHYRVRPPVITPEEVERLRHVPDDAVLDRIGTGGFGVTTAQGRGAVADAEEILRGRYATRRDEVVPVTLAPTPATFTAGSPMAQLQVSSLAVTQVLLDAYRVTREERFFTAALQSALGWARFEDAAWMPRGFLWNDHAIANRVVVLADLWREYRRRADFDPVPAGELLAFVARSTALLARDAHFTARTNHGVMQNLALLHAAAAFPGLPGGRGQVAVALERLARQLPYYVSPGGIVLEHSLGYQDFAIRLLRQGVLYADILGVDAPEGLRERYAAAVCYRLHVTRPDGTVPVYGDTFDATTEPLPDPVPDCPATQESLVDEDFGYASLRNFSGGGDQLFAAWANFPGRAHKHDDELAVWYWAGGSDWWTGTGYWPYGEPSRGTAVSWRGSNAPHAQGEGASTGSVSALAGVRGAGPVRFLDLERENGSGVRIRRQVASLGANRLLVLDSATGGATDARLEVVWTLPPPVVAGRPAAADEPLALQDVRTGRVARVWFLGGEGHSLRRLRGSREPFGGLVAESGAVTPTESVVTSAAFGGWLGMVLTADGAPDGGRAEVTWEDAGQWRASVGLPDGTYTLARAGMTLTFTAPSAAPVVLSISAAAGAGQAQAQAVAAYRDAMRRYPVFRDLLRYRARASGGVGALALLQVAGLVVLRRFGAGIRLLTVLVTCGWVAVAAWLYYGYLV